MLKQNLESLLDSHREIPDYKKESASQSSTSVVTGSRFENGNVDSSGSSLKEGKRSDPRNEVLVKNPTSLTENFQISSLVSTTIRNLFTRQKTSLQGSVRE